MKLSKLDAFDFITTQSLLRSYATKRLRSCTNCTIIRSDSYMNVRDVDPLMYCVFMYFTQSI